MKRGRVGGCASRRPAEVSSHASLPVWLVAEDVERRVEELETLVRARLWGV